MGFLDVLGKVANGVLESIDKQQQRISEYEYEYSRYDDEYLIRKYRELRETHSNKDLLMAIIRILKDRGYGNQV